MIGMVFEIGAFAVSVGLVAITTLGLNVIGAVAVVAAGAALAGYFIAEA